MTRSLSDLANALGLPPPASVQTTSRTVHPDRARSAPAACASAPQCRRPCWLLMFGHKQSHIGVGEVRVQVPPPSRWRDRPPPRHHLHPPVPSREVEGSGSLSLKNSTYADETGISTTGSGGQWNISPKFSMPSSRARASCKMKTDSRKIWRIKSTDLH